MGEGRQKEGRDGSIKGNRKIKTRLGRLGLAGKGVSNTSKLCSGLVPIVVDGWGEEGSRQGYAECKVMRMRARGKRVNEAGRRIAFNK